MKHGTYKFDRNDVTIKEVGPCKRRQIVRGVGRCVFDSQTTRRESSPARTFEHNSKTALANFFPDLPKGQCTPRQKWTAPDGVRNDERGKAEDLMGIHQECNSEKQAPDAPDSGSRQWRRSLVPQVGQVEERS